MTKLLSTDGEGERLDRFELIAELASGGMATVYLARIVGVAGFQRLYAIKRLHPHLAREPEFVEMFLDEARLAAKIHHPHVVPILEIGESDKGYYLVMEYVEGDTAARLFGRCLHAGRKLPFQVGIRILLDTLAGLHAAHELKDDDGRSLELVHRDVSPQNVLVGVDGTSRLTDFGVARAATRLTTTRSGHLKGKLAYMAPEQARGEKIDRRADVFAAGVILWEMLTFRRLFKGEGEADTLNRLLYTPIPNVREAEPNVPQMLEIVTMRALAREADRRFASAADLADALEAAARGVRALGTTRDVAQLVESVIGTELSAQREAVRQWCARSEPSQPRKSVTTSSAPAPAARTGPPTSSLSSTTLAVPPSMPSEPRPASLEVAGASAGRSRAWLATGAFALVAAAAVGWAVLARHEARPLPAPAAPPPPTIEAPPTTDLGGAPAFPTAPAPSAAPAPPDTGTAKPATMASSTVRPKPAPPAPRPRPPADRPRPPAPPPPPPATTGVPDDLSHNPYR